jgi:hypothetical protein
MRRFTACKDKSTLRQCMNVLFFFEYFLINERPEHIRYHCAQPGKVRISRGRVHIARFSSSQRMVFLITAAMPIPSYRRHTRRFVVLTVAQIPEYERVRHPSGLLSIHKPPFPRLRVA